MYEMKYFGTCCFWKMINFGVVIMAWNKSHHAVDYFPKPNVFPIIKEGFK